LGDAAPLDEVIIRGQCVDVLRGNSKDLRVHREFVTPLFIVVCRVKNLLVVFAECLLLCRFCGSGFSVIVVGRVGDVSSRTVGQFGFDPVIEGRLWGWHCLFGSISVGRKGMKLGVVRCSC